MADIEGNRASSELGSEIRVWKFGIIRGSSSILFNKNKNKLKCHAG